MFVLWGRLRYSMQRVSIDVRASQPDALPGPGIVPRRQRPRRRTARFLVVLISVVLLGHVLVGERGLITLIRSSHQLAAVSDLIDTLRTENAVLREEVRSLLEEPRAIEELARRELGLIEPGEKVFIFGHAREESPELVEDASEP